MRWPCGEDLTLDDKLRTMLRELSRALSAAIADSEEVGASIRRIRQEGYAIHLLVDCKREDAAPEVVIEPELAPPASDNSFRINGNDLAFLRSIGIDPTRRRRRSKPRRTVDPEVPQT
jgi:hypothetical protein